MGAWLVSEMTELDSVAAQYDIEAAHIYSLLNPDGAGDFGIVDVSGTTATPNAEYNAVQSYLAP